MNYWIILFLLFPAFVASAASPTPKEKVEIFFDSVVQGDVSSAYDQLFIGSSIPKDKPQSVTLLKL